MQQVLENPTQVKDKHTTALLLLFFSEKDSHDTTLLGLRSKYKKYLFKGITLTKFEVGTNTEIKAVIER